MISARTTPDPGTLTMEPGNLLDRNGNYCMQQKTSGKLMKYVWTGILLPTNIADFETRIGITTLEDSLVSMVQTLLATYTKIASGCKNFKDVTYPSVVHLADDVYTYAQSAGGTADDSFYVAILSTYLHLMSELAKTPPDPQTVAMLKTSITELIANETAQMDHLRIKAGEVSSDLRNFEQQTQEVQQELNVSMNAFTTKLSGDGGEMAILTQDIQSELGELAADQAEYEHDIIVACTSLSYSWIWPFGTIAAGVVMGIYGADAVKMQRAMAGMNSLIDSNQAQLQADQHLMADINLINTSLQGVLDLIGPAIEAIEEMMGFWDSVARDLQAIETFVETNSATGTIIVQKLEQKHILAMWNTLADSVDNYRKAAFISEIDTTTLDQWEKDAGTSKMHKSHRGNTA